MADAKQIRAKIQAVYQMAAEHLAMQQSGKACRNPLTGGIDDSQCAVAVLAIAPTDVATLRTIAQQILSAAKDEQDVYPLALQYGLIRETMMHDGQIA